MNFDVFWVQLWEKIPSYANSHIYDIVTYSIGTAVMIFMQWIKDLWKIPNGLRAKKRFGDNYMGHYRRRNLLIPIVAGCLSLAAYVLIVKMSNRMLIDTWWTAIAFLVPVAEYTVIEQMEKGGFGGRILILAFVAGVLLINKVYTTENAGHHKLCYAIKALAIFFGMAGLIGQLIYRKKSRKRHSKKQAA